MAYASHVTQSQQGCEVEAGGAMKLAWQWRLTGALQFLLGPWKV